MGTTVTTHLSSGSDWDNRDAGDGLCVFFYDSISEFYPGGIGSSLGYTNYQGPLCYHAETLGAVGGGTATGSASATSINGIKKAYVGVGFDIRGNYTTTVDGKLGEVLGDVTTNAGADKVETTEITEARPNTIGVRLGESSYYKVHSVSHDLSVFPVASAERLKESPAVNLHQSVSEREDVVFTSARVTLQNKGKRVLVEIKDNVTGIYHPYHVADLATGFGGSNPNSVKVGLSFATSDAITNCEIKNFTVQGKIIDQQKSIDDLTPSTSHNFYVATD